MFKKFHYVLFSISVLPALAIMPGFADEATEVSDWVMLKSVVAPLDTSGVGGGDVMLMNNIEGPAGNLSRAYMTADVSIDFNGHYIGGADTENVVNIGGDDQVFWISSGTTTFDGAQFQNISGAQSGLVKNYGGETIFNGDTVFSNISVTDSSAAFMNSSAGTNVFNGSVLFSDNTTGLISTMGSIAFNNNAIFTGNTGSNGGALRNDGDGTVTFALVDGGIATMFEENSSTADGGGVYNNGGAVNFNNAVNFVYNHAGSYGGGIANYNGSTIFAQDVAFNGNTAASYGAALYNTGTMTFDSGASFYGNASNTVDVVHNTSTGTLTFNGGISYLNNGNLDDGTFGTFTNQGITTIVGDGIFRGTVGQAIQNEGMFTVSGADLFEISGSTDGIFGSTGGNTMSITADEILISNNSTVTSYGGISNMGANAYFYGSTNTFSNNVQSITIDKEYYKLGGGALQNRALGNGGVTIIGLDDDSSTNVFSNNKSNKNGGAIHARAENNGDVGSVTINGTTTFVGNQAGEQGGAISNMPLLGQSTFTFNGNVSFQNNIAGGDGGAIYNNGNMTFNGDVTFSGNKSGATFTFDEDTNVITGYTGGVANDIYNNGMITFGGDVTLDGGILGSGTIVLANGKVLNIGNACITQGAIQMNGGRIVAAIDSPDYEGGIINVGEFSGDGTIALTLGDVGTYTIFGNSTFGGTVFEGDITFESPIYNLAWNDDNTVVTAERKTAEQIATDSRVSDESANTVLNLMDSSSAALNDLGMAVQEQLALQNVATVEDATKAIHPETASVVQSVSTSVQNAIANLAAGRMSMVQSSVGRSGGDAPARSGLWVEGMYNKSKQNDVFNGYTRGVALGVDTRLSRSLMLGAGYSYAHSDISAIARNTEIDSNTIFIYGQYKPTAWYMNAMANYTMSDYSEKSDVLGVAVKSDFDVDALGAAVMTGYDFAGGITPEIGVRYVHVSADEYKNSLGIKSKLDDADYLTAVLGTKYAFDYRVSRGFTLRPELRYAVKYDLISDKSVAVITMPGVPSYVLDGERLSRIGAELGAGIVMKYNGFSLAFNYDIEIREDYTSQTGRVRARMLF